MYERERGSVEPRKSGSKFILASNYREKSSTPWLRVYYVSKRAGVGLARARFQEELVQESVYQMLHQATAVNFKG